MKAAGALADYRGSYTTLCRQRASTKKAAAWYATAALGVPPASWGTGGAGSSIIIRRQPNRSFPKLRDTMAALFIRRCEPVWKFALRRLSTRSAVVYVVGRFLTRRR